MHIFIDETGTFTGIGQPLSISMIGALMRLRSAHQGLNAGRVGTVSAASGVSSPPLGARTKPFGGFFNFCLLLNGRQPE